MTDHLPCSGEGGRDHPRALSHALPTLQAEAMGRLDAVLGRSPLDVPDDAVTKSASVELWGR